MQKYPKCIQYVSVSTHMRTHACACTHTHTYTHTHTHTDPLTSRHVKVLRIEQLVAEQGQNTFNRECSSVNKVTVEQLQVSRVKAGDTAYTVGTIITRGKLDLVAEFHLIFVTQMLIQTIALHTYVSNIIIIHMEW